MKCISLLLMLALLLVCQSRAESDGWRSEESLPADIRELIKEKRSAEIGDRIRSHLEKWKALSDEAVLSLVYALLRDVQTPVDDVVERYGQRLIARPATGLEVALMLVHNLDTTGHMEGDKFVRSADPEQMYQVASCRDRNRWQALRLTLAIRDSLAGKAPIPLQAQLYTTLAQVLSTQNPQEHWLSSRSFELLQLTDLKAVPEIDLIQSRGYGWQLSAAGNNPADWLFTLPDSFESAKSDGERWRWALAQLAALGGTQRSLASSYIASVMSGVFTATRLPGLSGEAPIVGVNQVPEAPELALHTLDDDEAVVISGGELKRLRLPPELSFMANFKKVVLDGTTDAETRDAALYQMEREWQARWQYDRLPLFMKQTSTPIGPGDSGQQVHYRLDEEERPRLRFESHPPQIPGQPAKLRLMFRNVTKARFTAQAVDMKKIVADIDKHAQQPWKNDMDRKEWKSRAIEGLHERLTGKNAAQWLQAGPIRWTTALEPAPHRWDRQTDITTPLSKAGVYLITCDAGMEKPEQTLLSLDELVVVKIPQEEAPPPVPVRPAASPAQEATLMTDPFGQPPIKPAQVLEVEIVVPAMGNDPFDPFGGGYVPARKRLSRYLVLDAATGRPVPGARMTLTGGSVWENGGKDQPFTKIERQTDENGSLVVSDEEAPEDLTWLMRVEDQEGRLHVLGPRVGWNYPRTIGYRLQEDIPSNVERLFLFTDLPAYHPGQEARWMSWLRKRDFSFKADTNPFANRDLTLALSTQKGTKKLLEKKTKLNAEGAAHGTVSLPAAGVLGSHTLSLQSSHTSNHQFFPVEEYRKPEFVASASVNGPPTALGGKFEFHIDARYYTGAALVGGMVRYHVTRMPLRWSSYSAQFPASEWDWLYGNGHAWSDTVEPMEDGSGDRGGEVTSGLVPLRADGTAVITVNTLSTALLNGASSQVYHLQAWVMDATQRNAELTAEHTVTAQPCTLLLDADHGFYHAGESGTLTLRCFNTDASPVAVTAILRHTAPDGSVSAIPLPALQNGQSQFTLDFKRGGMHRLRIEATLPDGQQATVQRDISVLDEALPDLTTASDSAVLDVQTRNLEHAPGDTAELLITSRRADADVWLFIRPTDGVYPAPVHLRLKGHHALYRVPVTEEDFPNFFVQAATLFEGCIFNIKRQVFVPPKHVIAKVRFELDKPRYQPGDQCRVKIITTRNDGSPLSANVAFTAYDKMLDAVRLQSSDVQHQNLYPELPDIRHFFWGWRRRHVQFITDTARFTGLVDYSFPSMAEYDDQGYYPWQEENDRAGAFLCGNDSSSIPPSGTAARAMPGALAELLNETHIRQNQRDSIAWEPELHTNERGEATVEFKLPDNLTTWSLKAWAVGAKTEVGQAAHDLRVSKPLELRIATPRFLLVGDAATLTASIIHGELKNQPVQAVIELQGTAVKLLDEVTQSTTLDANGGAQITWRIQAAAEGDCVIRIKAACGTVADATEITLPVSSPQTAQLENWDISVAPGQKERSLEFTVPVNGRQTDTRLELRLTPSVLSVITDALPYLAEYPHGCAEQTLNRFLPALIAQHTCMALKLHMHALQQSAQQAENKRSTMKLPEHLQRWQRDEHLPRWHQASLFDIEKVQAMAATGLARLTDMIVHDHRTDGAAGGWPWFGGNERANTQITALIIHGFLQARRNGLEVNNDALATGFMALKKHEEKQLRSFTDPDHHGRKEKHLGDDLDVLVHVTLVESLEPPMSSSNPFDAKATLRDGDSLHFHKAQPAAAMRQHLISSRNQLAPISIARLAMACHQLGETNDRDLLLRQLKGQVKSEAKAHIAWIDASNNGTWQQDFIETQAAFLRLLVCTESSGTLAADVARNLIICRSQGRVWNSTRDTAASIEALAAYALATGETEKHQAVEVLLDGSLRHSFGLERASSLATVPSIVFGAKDLGPGKHTLTLRLKGGGELAASAGLQHFGAPAGDAGGALKLTRRLWRIDPAAVQANQATYQPYWWSQRAIQHELVTSDTPLKAGDMIEMEYRFEANQSLEYLLLESPLPAALQPVQPLSGWEQQEDLSGYQEVRDDRVCMFMERLNHGPHTLRILTRVENAGVFTLPPASITAMYSPVFHATCHGQIMRVK